MSKVREALTHIRLAEVRLVETLAEFPTERAVQCIQKMALEFCVKLLVKARHELEEWIEDNLEPVEEITDGS